MAEFSFPFDVSVAGDRTVTADTFATMLNSLVSNGVVSGADDGLAVSQSSTPAMSVSVATGRAFIGHTSKRRYYRNTAAVTLTIEAADGSNPRDDLIVLEMAEATGTRAVNLKVVKGTAAGSPSDPSLTTTEATYQFAIARVRVGAGVSTIVNANITDLRSTTGYAGLPMAMENITALDTDTIASGDFIGFSDESESGDPSNKITVDNLMETGIPLVTEDTVAVATDYMLFLDGGASGNTNKESIQHFVSAIAGTGLSESSGQLVVGNESTATALATARAINGVDFDGTAAITVTAAGSTLSDTVPVSKGGTNATSLADKAVLITQDSGTDTVSAVTMSTNGQVLIGGTDGPAVTTLTAGTGIGITNGNGSITIAATSSGASEGFAIAMAVAF